MPPPVTRVARTGVSPFPARADHGHGFPELDDAEAKIVELEQRIEVLERRPPPTPPTPVTTRHVYADTLQCPAWSSGDGPWYRLPHGDSGNFTKHHSRAESKLIVMVSTSFHAPGGTAHAVFDLGLDGQREPSSVDKPWFERWFNHGGHQAVTWTQPIEANAGQHKVSIWTGTPPGGKAIAQDVNDAINYIILEVPK